MKTSEVKALIKKAHEAITRHKKEYAPNVHEIQNWINQHLKKQNTMKKLTLALLISLISVSAKAQLYQYAIDEPASTLKIEYTENPDSLYVFTFTSDKGVPYEVPATGAYWRNGDFITIAPLGALLEVSYRISGRVTFRKLKKQ